MKESIKQKILFYLTEKRDWVYGGLIEDFIRQTDGHKASNASRRCRELEDEGKVERRIVKLNGLSVVQYRIKNECCGSYKLFQIHARDCEKLKVGVLL